MTTINTLDDFLQALDANPSWREAVRARILGEELLQLPVRFEAFAQEQKTWNTNVEARLNRIEGDMSGLKGESARTRAIQDARGIAEDRGLEYVRTLTNDDLNGMARGNLDPGRAPQFPERRPGHRSHLRNRHPVHRDGDFIHG